MKLIPFFIILAVIFLIFIVACEESKKEMLVYTISENGIELSEETNDKGNYNIEINLV